MQMQQPLSQQQQAALIGMTEQFEYLSALAEVAGSAVADSYSESDIESVSESSQAHQEPSCAIWGQVMVWQEK